MEYNIEKTEAYSIASITRPDAETVVVYISADLHEVNSVHAQATAQMYTEALVSGCRGYDRDAFHEAISLLGASINVEIVNGELTISIKTIATNAEKVLSIFAAMMSAPTFKASEFKRIRALCINELHERMEDAKDIAQDVFVNQLYDKRDRRYSYAPEVLIREIPNITKKDLVVMHTRAMQQFWFCTIGGNEKVLRSFRHTLKAVKAKVDKDVVRIHRQKVSFQKVVLTDIPSKQNIEFSIGGPLPLTLHHPDYLPFVFGLNVLGKWGGFTGRLMSTVREKEGLTYGIYARTETVFGDEQGYWRIMTFFAPTQTEQGIRSTLREVNAIRERGITKEEFIRFKTILGTQQSLLRDSLQRSLGELHNYHTNGFTLEEIESHKERLLTVTKREVDEALKKYIDPTKFVVSGAGPVSTVKKSLLKLL